MHKIRTRALVGLSLFSIIGLAACGNSEIVVDEAAQSAAATQSVPNLDVPRISEMLRETQAVFDKASADKNPALLSDRMADPALRLRQAQFVVAEKSGAPIPVLDLTESLVTVTNSADWPRVVLDVSKPTEGQLPAAYFFVQEDARSGYKLQNWTRLLGGTEFSTLSVKEGTPYLKEDAEGFIVTPKEAVAKYVDMLNSNTAGSDTFTADEFTLNYVSTLQQLNDSVKAAGTVTATATTADFPVTAVQLRDGSALVTSAITFTHTYDRTIARSTMKLGGTPAVFAGDPAVIGKAQANYMLSILIHLPAKAPDAKATLIGVERALESVVKDDAAKPEGE